MINKFIDIPIGKRFFDSSEAYRATEVRQHSVYIAMPQYGTTFTNNLTGENFAICDVTPVAISGTIGELFAAPLKVILDDYSLKGGGSLYDYLRQQFGNKTLYFDWLHVRSLPSTKKFYTLFIPETEQFRFTTADGTVYEVNHPRCEHGGGDFIVCSSLAGKPNLADKWVVNGNVFRAMFTTRGKLSMFSTGKQVPVTPKPQKSFFDGSIILKDFKLSNEPVKSETQEPQKISVPVSSTSQKCSESMMIHFHKIALYTALALCDYGISHSSRPQQAANNTSRFSFKYSDKMQRTAVIMLCMQTWKYTINFNSAERETYFIRGEAPGNNASGVVRVLSDAIKKEWC
jgi:hypothetical protein